MKRNIIDDKVSSVLGVFSKNQKIFLFRNASAGKENFFKVDVSSDGFYFNSFSNKAEIIKKDGKREKIKKCRDFRISRFKKGYFLTYYNTASSTLCGALSDDLIHWKKSGEISNLGQTGIIVPNYKHKGKYVLFLAGESIKIALSKDLITWKVLNKPFFKLSKEVGNNRPIKINSLIKDKKGIRVIYSVLGNKKSPANYFIGVITFDRKNPKKRLWKSDKIIWEQTAEWINQQINPVGTTILGNQLISYWQASNGELFALSHPYFKSILKDSKSISSFFALVLKKFKQNPILKPITSHFWESKFVFNPAVIYEAGKVHLVYRAVGENDISVLGYASSKDGIHINERLKDPVYVPREPFELNPQAPQVHFNSYMSGGGCGGCEDPRLTRIKNRIYMIYVAWNGRDFPRVALTSIKVDDFLNKKWNWRRPVLISPPGEIHKNWIIFPEKINDKYAILHSLSPKISIAYVDSLKFDGNTYIKSYYSGVSRKNCWDSWVRGAGPPPIKTEIGWLLFYHAMDNRDPGKYKLGAMILDLEDPSKVIFRSKKPILEPSECYENEGFKAGVVYACGAAIVNDHLFVYYGGADTVVCAATAKLSEFLDQLKYSGSARLESLSKI